MQYKLRREERRLSEELRDHFVSTSRDITAPNNLPISEDIINKIKSHSVLQPSGKSSITPSEGGKS